MSDPSREAEFALCRLVSPESEEPIEVEPLPAPSQDETSPSRRLAFRGRLAGR